LRALRYLHYEYQQHASPAMVKENYCQLINIKCQYQSPLDIEAKSTSDFLLLSLFRITLHNPPSFQLWFMKSWLCYNETKAQYLSPNSNFSRYSPAIYQFLTDSCPANTRPLITYSCKSSTSLPSYKLTDVNGNSTASRYILLNS